MIDPRSEGLVPLASATSDLPIRIDPSTWRRWAVSGVKGAVLETVRIGARLYTTREAVQRFLSRLNPGK